MKLARQLLASIDYSVTISGSKYIFDHYFDL